ncbi:MAG: hypothetical protein PHG14_06705 [Desulfobacter postgatei]|uniref:hypothetical protein n=1 Tax=Desulfobacter postgatei TaxID=2293 RepID=UPI0023F1803B|nr:hypothetical protein [Desulfobacter postgatei]MDD4273401.1 hypothetical protein [Desulfobacter postgatei]
MTKTEFTTIADALKTKQSLIRKEFEDLLSAWYEATSGMNHIGNVYIGNFDIDDESFHYVFLVPGVNSLHYSEEGGNTYYREELDYYIEDGYSSRNYRDALTISLIRWAAPRISPAIIKHFKNIQEDIDALSEFGQEIRRITSCLEK